MTKFFAILGKFSLFSTFFGLFVEKIVKIYGFLLKITIKANNLCAKYEKCFLLALGWMLMFPTSQLFTLPPLLKRKFLTFQKKYKIFVTKSGCYVNKTIFLLELSNFFGHFLVFFHFFHDF